MKKALFIFLTIVMAFSQICFADSTLEIGGLRNLAPFLYIENGQTKGIDWEVYLELKKRVGFESNVKLLPFKRIWIYLVAGHTDGVMHIYHNSKREAVLIYPKNPVRWSAYHIFVRKENLSKFPSNSMADLYGKKVGNNIGFFVSAEFGQAAKQNKFRLDEAKTANQNIKKLNKGRIDCYVGNYHIGLSEIKKLGLQGKIVPLPKPFIPRKGVYFAISKKGKGISDKDGFMKKLNTALKEIHSDGTFQRIEKKYTQ